MTAAFWASEYFVRVVDPCRLAADFAGLLPAGRPAPSRALMAGEAYSYISSRLVKEVFGLGADISGLVPPSVESRLKKRKGI